MEKDSQTINAVTITMPVATTAMAAIAIAATAAPAATLFVTSFDRLGRRSDCSASFAVVAVFRTRVNSKRELEQF